MADRRSAGGKRLDGLIDSAFAFSATLLVVGKSGTMQSYSDLLASFANVPAFGLSMIVIISFWWAHRQYSLLVPRYDAASDAISLLILFVILIFVFPLSFLAEALTHWLSDGRLPGRGLTADETRNAYFVFGTGFCVLSGLYTALFGMALRTTNAARISNVMRPRVCEATLIWIWCIMAGGVSLVTASIWNIQQLIWVPSIPYLLLLAYLLYRTIRHFMSALRQRGVFGARNQA